MADIVRLIQLQKEELQSCTGGGGRSEGGGTSLPAATKVQSAPPKQERMMKRPCRPWSTLYSMVGACGMPGTSSSSSAPPSTHAGEVTTESPEYVTLMT